MDLSSNNAVDRPVHPIASFRDSAHGRATGATTPMLRRRSGMRGAALALLGAFLGGGMWLPTSAQAAQGPLAPVPQQAAPTSTIAPAAGTINCPPGAQLLTFTPPQDCYPSVPIDCVSFEDGFWLDRPLALDKFPGTLGSLQRLRLDYEIEVQGFFCYDNSSNKCCFGGANVGSTAQLEPNNLLNNPPLAQPPVSSVDVAFSITNIVLGPTNGNFDCFIPNPGVPTDGTCTGGDYGVTPFQATGNLPSIFIDDPTELAKWVASPGNTQTHFLSNIQPLVENFFACNVSTNLDTEARVKLQVTYEYCTNSPPICVGEGTPVVTAEDTPVDIFLIDRVADVDGCIDCSTFQITSPPSHGTLSGFLGCTGQGGTFPGCNDCGQCRVVYTPTSNYCGPDQFSFTVNDDDGAPVTCTVLIQVTPVNDPPVCTKASFGMLEDGFLDIDLCALSSDVDDLNGCGDLLDCNAFVIVKLPSCGGTLNHLGSGVYRFTPPANFCGLCTFTYRAVDAGGRLSAPCEVDIVVAGVNDPPICSNAGFNTPEDTPVLLDLCALVTDPDNATPGCGDPFDCNIQIVQQPSCGTLAPQGNGTFLFTPAANFCGQCTFTYRALDTGGRQSAICTVTMTVTPVNDPPVCAGASFRTQEDTPINLDLCALVSDVDNGTACGDPFQCNIQIVNQPSCGSLTPLGNGVFTFTPTANFCGQCTFTYRAVDAGGRMSAICTVTVTVTGVNDPPVCTGATFNTDEDVPLFLDLCALVTDADDANGCGDGFDCNIQIVQQPSCGTLTPLGNGTYTFTPTANFCGQCTLTYRAVDSGGRMSDICTVTIIVTGVNDPPVCTGASVTTAEDTSLLIDLCALVTDPDNASGCGDPYQCGIEIVSPPSCGNLVAQGNGVYRFDPTPNECGVCTFTYRAIDAGGRPSGICTVTVTVTPVNDPPVCTAATFNTDEDTPLFLDLCALVTDADNANNCGDVFDCNIQIVQQPSCGALTSLGNGTYTFTPTANFCGQCTFTYRALDTGGRMSAICTITIVVAPVNDPPVCTDATFTTPQNVTKLIDLCALVSDPDNASGCGSPFNCDILIVTQPPCGTLAPLGNGTFNFIPTPDTCGQCTFTYRARDGAGRLSEICTVTLIVQPVNLPPVALDDFAVTSKNVPVLIDVCLNDSDPNDGTDCGAPLDCCSITYLGDLDCVSMLGVPGGVEVVVDEGKCKFRFTPPLDFIGTCTFNYRIFDTGTPALFDEALVTVVIEERCDPTGLRRAGSMLLYPEFDNREGIVTVYTITNTSRTQDMSVKFWYVDKETCSTFDRSHLLTATDTLTLITNFHNPQQEQGFCYVVAQCAANNKPVVFNHLVGQMHVLDGIENFGFSINAVAFPGIGEGGALSSCGVPFTDVNGNKIHELNGIEYGPAPDEILMPRFFGQDVDYNSELILIGLSGGKQFTTTVDFLIYNDNEEVFSAEHTFYCWTRVDLLDINFVFGAEFLRDWTNHDPNEVLGDTGIETGWMRIKGALANSINTTILNPAIYAVLIERTDPLFEVSDLPWGRCSRETGGLLPKSNNGQF